jgi:DNA repair protein RadC
MVQIKDLPEALRPREKALKLGISCLSDDELLAVILSSGYQGVSALELAREILRETGGLGGLMSRSMAEIMEIKGVKLAKAAQLAACQELVKRERYDGLQQADVIASPQALVRWLQAQIGNNGQESFLAVFLDIHNRVKGHQEIFRGSSDTIHIQARELFAQALRQKACRLIIAHNHPSQSVAPSAADRQATRELSQAGALMNIPVLDHIIVAAADYYSFREHGLL